MPVCAQCGQEIPDGFRFCGSCGAPLVAGPVSEERKVVTVLFADLVDFTSRSERMDVEDVRGTLAPYHALLRRKLEHYGGTVEKFIGDAVMALFGAPVAHEDDPERAVRAALEIRAAIERLNEEIPSLDLHVRVGVNTGEALVVLGADPAAGEGMASGDVVNTAARLQAAAPVDGILVGETTHRATDRAITYRPAAPVEAKGKSRPVVAWEALQARARFGIDVAQRPTTPLVGRSEELDLLLDALRRCRSERTVQLVTLVGVPGIGKSRLVWELLQEVDRDPDFITWRQGRSLPYGDGVTYWALGEMVKAQADILDSDTAQQAQEKLHATVADMIADPGEAGWVEEHVRALVALEGGPTDGNRHDEATSAWRRFFEALADRYPLVLVFEDLHWGDDALLDFVDHLVDWSSGVPMLVVCTARPELLDRRRGWGGGKRNTLTVSLSPLPDSDIARLIADLLEQAVLPAETQAALLGTAAGNPLYAEEYVRMLIDRGHLRRGSDRWRLRAGVDLPVPESVQGLIAARVDGLPAEEKRLLQDASVVGKVVWVGALAAMADLPRFAVEARLHALERREMLRRERRSSVGGETEYAFRHVLMRDVAYGQIPRAQRADKHRRAAEWIESLSADRDNAPDMLAHHYARALDYARDAGRPTEELERRARLAYREAAERAAALNSMTVALHHYQAARVLWPESDPDWPTLIVELADISLAETGDDTLVLLRRARDRLIEAGDPGTAAKAEMLAGFRFWNRALTAESTDAFQRAWELVEGAEPSPTVARVISRIAVNAMLRGQFEETVELCGRVLAIAAELGLEELRGHALNTRGVARVDHGDRDGLADIEQAVEIAERMNAADAIIRGYKNLASVLATLGELDRAAELQRRGLEVARRFGAPYQIVWFDTELGIHAFSSGDWDEADSAFARLDAFVAQGSPHYMESAAHSARAKLRAARGDLAGAEADCRSALDFGRRSGDPQVVYPALADAALVAATGGGPDAPARVASLVDELARAAAGGGSIRGSDWGVTLAAALALTGQAERFSFPEGDDLSRWDAPARMLAAGRFDEAADALAAIGARAEEALARLLAARSHLSAGRTAEGEAQLRAAVAFWERARASMYLARAADMLAGGPDQAASARR
ncbi:MAG TPA: adenylate/guanylate cyclase domain-containing protein [Gaiellales bacterium]|nr:adenylate/guanylate cyclase domain-containing protein [Gaiellales bacterium]